VTGTAARASYGLRYWFAPDDFYALWVTPAKGMVGVWSAREGRWLSQHVSEAIPPDAETNLMRLEFRADTLMVSLNGQQVDQMQRDDLRRRGGSFQLGSGAPEPLPDGDVDVRYTDFRVVPLIR
jgi:hypothetical protein